MVRCRTIALALALTACGSTPTPPPDAQSDVALDAHADDAHAVDVHAVDARDAGAADAPSRCVNGAPLPYPPAPAALQLGMTLPDLRFETAAGATSLGAWYAPCAAAPRLLVVRALAAWSGPSQHAAAHTARLRAHPQAARLAFLDLLALGPDNLPAGRDDLAAWARRYDAQPDALAADPSYALRALYLTAGELPAVGLVDTRTMTFARVFTRPSSDELAYEITAALARMDGQRPPAAPPRALVDGRLTQDEWEMVQAMALPPAPPPDPTNRVADDPRAAALGERLFLDATLSRNGQVSCGTCHDAQRGFGDGMATSVGARFGDRNAPTVVAAAYTRWLFWDGRADSAWSQALGPVENPAEMASTRTALAHRIRARYAAEYTALFGPLPPLEDAARFPPSAMPGDDAWARMTPADREAVDRVFVNFGKAVAAYERTLRPPSTALDRYARGDRGALTEAQREGLALFFESGCAQCHHGPMLTDDSFHNIGMPTGRRDRMPDRGRADAIEQLQRATFRADSPFSDAPATRAHLANVRAHPSQVGQFHTPTLRGVARTGPWGHGGTFTTLEEVVRHYSEGLSRPAAATTAGERDLHLPSFHMDDRTLSRIADALRAMSQ